MTSFRMLKKGACLSHGSRARAMKFHVFGVGVLSLMFLSPLLSQSTLPRRIADPVVDPSLAASSPVETINVNVHEVDLVLSVTDHRGKFVNSLQPSDLTILDNGVEQTKLTFFERETDLPIKIALVLDISASVTYLFDTEKNAIRSFLRAVARPTDSVTLFAFNESIQLTSPVTNNWNETAKRVKRLKPGGETALYDAVSSASQWLALDQGPVRRIMILVSDGEDNRSRATIGTAISDVLKANAAIYSVNVNQESVSDEAKHGAGVLKQLAESTGGAYLNDPEHNVAS